ncbi:YetF domain-containing protein [Ferdinandcohnia sp. SAFN-114]|uniref:YetF domain-containing protein n=1 Tax=Ferdinandcohnia sp. SAFN-114 TaxID=3387275 RepID=UPI003F7E232A
MNQLLDFFKLTEELSTAGFAVRAVVSVILIYFMSRFLMKRAAGQFTAFDFTFLWMLGALAVAPVLDGKILFTTTILATATLYFWHFALSWFSVRNHAFAALLTRKPTVLIEKGKINDVNMRRSFFSADVLLSEMRLSDAPDLTEVDQVILETSGHLSVIKKSGHIPPTPVDFQIPIPSGGLPRVLVNNGKVMYNNLKSLNYKEEWLQEQLNKQGIINIEDVYLAMISPNGEFYYSVKNS